MREGEVMTISKCLVDYVSDGDYSTWLDNVEYSTNLREILTVEDMQESYLKGGEVIGQE
jgi:hypothetical protein